jgi:hypothetical protein
MEAMAVDPVVAQHYADFDVTKAHRVTLDGPQLMYVSYRIGNKVFWTKHKLALRKGEAMLSDGVNMTRTRCGNRVSVPHRRRHCFPVRSNHPVAARVPRLWRLRRFFLCPAGAELVVGIRLLHLPVAAGAGLLAAGHPLRAAAHLVVVAAAHLVEAAVLLFLPAVVEVAALRLL